MRKNPSQERSRALVDSLIEATALTIAENGLEAATTARIAKRAGVSVGSLYQYFDSKDALYNALLHRMTSQMEELIDRQLEQAETLTLKEFLARILQAVWLFLEADNARYLQIVRNWSQLSTLPLVSALEQKTIAAIGIFLAYHPPKKPISNIPAKLYFLLNGAMFSQLRYVSQPPVGISRDQLLEVIIEQALALLGD